MPLPLSPLALSSLVTTLRSAGCVFAEDEADLIAATAAGPAELTAMVERRVAGHPLEHVLGWAEFSGLRIAVDPGVFVPRRRTEFLIRQAAELAPNPAVVVDLCCGSGALGAALAATLERVELHAADVEPAAVRCARRNVGELGRVYEGDLFAPCPAPCAGASTCSWPTCRTYRRAMSPCCPSRRASTNPSSPSTEAATAST